MKNLILFILLCGGFQGLMAQANGNANYYGNAGYTGQAPKSLEINPVWQGGNFNQLVIRVHGLYNARADKQVAIFSLSQAGKSIEEVNRLLDDRIAAIRAGLDSLKGSPEMFVDMISFVPVFEYEKEKKLFSKKTYNEIPKGFELKKNLHIGFADGNLLNDIVAVCAAEEVYDLVRVSYVSNHFEEIKDSLRNHAYDAYEGILANYARIHQSDFKGKKRSANEGFNVAYPIESYKSYQAFSSPNLDAGKAHVNDARKSTTQYYMPAVFRDHEFVMHPDIIEPTIQLAYSLEVRIDLTEKPEPKPVTETKVEKELLIVTPQGDLKRVMLSK